MAPHRRTILVADDEPIVRNVMASILTHANYRVLEADSAAEALTVSTAFEDVIDLLITDHILKTLTGRQLAERMLQDRPDLKVLHVSGHSQERLAEEGGIMPGAEFLPKPFTAQMLKEKVRQMIGDGSATPLARISHQ